MNVGKAAANVFTGCISTYCLSTPDFFQALPIDEATPYGSGEHHLTCRHRDFVRDS